MLDQKTIAKPANLAFPTKKQNMKKWALNGEKFRQDFLGNIGPVNLCQQKKHPQQQVPKK